MIMAKDKLKMSNKRFLIIMVPILVVLLAAIIVVTAVMNFFAPLMDAFWVKVPDTLWKLKEHLIGTRSFMM